MGLSVRDTVGLWVLVGDTVVVRVAESVGMVVLESDRDDVVDRLSVREYDGDEVKVSVSLPVGDSVVVTVPDVETEGDSDNVGVPPLSVTVGD